MPENPRIRPFEEVLAEMEGGRVLYDLEEGLTNLIAAVMDTKKPGTIELKIAVAPTGRGSVTMATNVKTKEPEHDRPTSTFFVDDKWQLHRDDPRQEKMDLRTADEPEGPIREVPEDEEKGLRVVGRDD